jgi:hypothetical protein
MAAERLPSDAEQHLLRVPLNLSRAAYGVPGSHTASNKGRAPLASALPQPVPMGRVAKIVALGRWGRE